MKNVCNLYDNLNLMKSIYFNDETLKANIYL